MANQDTEKKDEIQEKKQTVSSEEEKVLIEPEIATEKSKEKISDRKEKKEEETTIKSKKKKKLRRQVQRGRAYINSTYNNTSVSLIDLHGNLLAWSSSGLLGFKGAKKATTFAANQVVIDVAEKVEKYGLKDIEIYVKGVGSGRESAVRALAQKGFNLLMIKDKTPIPHNGCRPKKPRRV